MYLCSCKWIAPRIYPASFAGVATCRRHFSGVVYVVKSDLGRAAQEFARPWPRMRKLGIWGVCVLGGDTPLPRISRQGALPNACIFPK